jgi:hypothetical protein
VGKLFLLRRHGVQLVPPVTLKDRTLSAALATMVMFIVACGGAARDDTIDDASCVSSHLEYFAKELNAARREGLKGISREDGINLNYPGDEYPEGCGPTGAPPDLLVCLPCGNGVCDPEENRCNCGADCSD